VIDQFSRVVIMAMCDGDDMRIYVRWCNVPSVALCAVESVVVYRVLRMVAQFSE
jgi:hypothetical protein